MPALLRMSIVNRHSTLFKSERKISSPKQSNHKILTSVCNGPSWALEIYSSGRTSSDIIFWWFQIVQINSQPFKSAFTGCQPSAINWRGAFFATPRLSRKLSVVAREARRRSNVLVRTHLISALHFRLSVSCKVKVRSKIKNVFTFWALLSVR